MNDPQAYNNFLYGRKYFYLFASKSETEKAREFFQKAIEFDPDFANGYVLLATLLYYTGQPQEGLERYDEAIAAFQTGGGYQPRSRTSTCVAGRCLCSVRRN